MLRFRTGKERWIDRTKRIFREVKILYMIIQWWIRVAIHLSKHMEGVAPRVNSRVTCSVEVIMMCGHRVTDDNRGTVLVGKC